jgi:hypothetical protein
MNIDWKHLSYAMFVSFIVIWVCALIVSVLFIQPLLDTWKCFPQILSGIENHSVTIAVSNQPTIPLWVLLILALLLWSVLTVISYVIMNSLKKKKKLKATLSKKV